ncbi:Histone H2B [Arachis hypogaea]|nr:Histone H2B [Arachis hypogaea]
MAPKAEKKLAKKKLVAEKALAEKKPRAEKRIPKKGGTEKKKKKNVETYKIYIFKVLK